MSVEGFLAIPSVAVAVASSRCSPVLAAGSHHYGVGPAVLSSTKTLDVVVFLKDNKEGSHDDPQLRNMHLTAKDNRTPHTSMRRSSRLRIGEIRSLNFERTSGFERTSEWLLSSTSRSLTLPSSIIKETIHESSTLHSPGGHSRDLSCSIDVQRHPSTADGGFGHWWKWIA